MEFLTVISKIWFLVLAVVASVAWLFRLEAFSKENRRVITETVERMKKLEEEAKDDRKEWKKDIQRVQDKMDDNTKYLESIIREVGRKKRET